MCIYSHTCIWPCEPYLLRESVGVYLRRKLTYGDVSGKTKSIPLYDERFVHYGNDKAQHVLNIFYKQV